MNVIQPLFHVKELLRQLYGNLLCPQDCLLCGSRSGTGLPICEYCIKTELEPYIGTADREGTLHRAPRCRHCGKMLISEIGYCTRCRSAGENAAGKPFSSCSRIFTLFPYIGLGQKLLPVWKNDSLRTFSAVFAPLVYRFLIQADIARLPVVPVPPRPRKLRERGWDQVEDLVKDLAAYPSLTIHRCLKRQDGNSQKKLSKAERATNLQGKISSTVKTAPDTVVLLDDVMTTGATLEACARVLHAAGCKKVYGLCLFFV